MSLFSKMHQKLIVDLSLSKNTHEVNSLLSTHIELMTPELVHQLAEWLEGGKVSLDLFVYVRNFVSRKLALQWLGVTDEMKENYLLQYRDLLVTDIVFIYLSEILESEENAKEYINEHIFNLIDIAIKMYFEYKDHQESLLFNTQMLLSHEIILQKDPILWAFFQAGLGEIYVKLQTGNHYDNQQIAISAFRGAVDVFFEQGHRLQAAEILNSLANVFMSITYADQSFHQESAIGAIEGSLEIYNKL